MPGGIHPPLATVVAWSKIANHLNPSETRGWGLVTLVVVLSLITLVTVVARIWARTKIQHNAGVDDVIIVATMASPIMNTTAKIKSNEYIRRFRQQAWLLLLLLITMLISATYVVSTSLTKISILLFYKRLSEGAVSKGFRFAVRLCIGFVVAYMVTFLATLFLTCRPINSYWNQVSIPWARSHEEGVDYRCFDEAADILAASAVSIVQDFIVCGLPTLLFWKLQLPRRQKLALGAIFGVGFFLCITGILRIIYITNIFFHTYDVTWATEPVWTWTAVEAHLAIVCASAPALKVFFRQYLSVSSMTGSWKDSSRRRSFFRKEYSEKAGFTTFGTSSTASKTPNSNNTTTVHDIELGRIEVIREVDVDSESVHSDLYNDSMFFDDTYRDSKNPSQLDLQSGGRDVDHSTRSQSSSGRSHAWRRQEH
ncbi:hypothetical protein FKW77_001161 [Venturia effusa]|uniref:Rhodopsin domain-containing protein n=1 Tax=Venturia effusa TaxID=50376 RepID=A0A517LD50_9PEZI|nr:hypothetical protein FKW77_001161 [Venturia effusa]